MNRLGGRIRNRREALHMSLGEVAQKAGISASALSQIENAKAFPSILTLKAVATALHITVGELIGENETIKHSPYLGAGEKRFIKKNSEGVSLYSLSHHETGKQMGTYLMEFPGGSSAEEFFEAHAGQEFCYLISGALKFSVETENFHLQAGDSLYYNSFKKRRAFNETPEPAQLLWVRTPPDTRFEQSLAVTEIISNTP